MPNIGIRICINFLAAARWRNKHVVWHEDGDPMVNAIARLKACNETCDSHMAWATFDIEARTWPGVQAEVARIIAQVERILSRYTRGSVTTID